MQTSLNQRSSIRHQTSEDHIDTVIKLIDKFETTMNKTVTEMLINKQSSVSNVYNQYIFKIKDEVTQLRQKIQHQNQRIHQYQSEGMVADLLKKIKFLENEQIQLLKSIDKKNSEIRQLKLENIINKSQNKRMQQKIKQFIRSKAQHGITIQNTSPQAFQSIQTFSTQTSPQKQVYIRAKLSQHQNSLKSRFTKQKSVRSQVTLNSQSGYNIDIIKLQKQLLQVKKQNKQLLFINNRISTQSQDAQKFFLDTIAEIKSNISLRRKIKQCSFEQFRKQDKLQLLIKIISNQQILFHLYRKIFGKNTVNQREQTVTRSEKDSKQKSNIHPKARFPTINSGSSFLV